MKWHGCEKVLPGTQPLLKAAMPLLITNIRQYKSHLITGLLFIWLFMPALAIAIIPGPWSFADKAWIVLLSVAQVCLFVLLAKTLRQVFWTAILIAFVSPFYFFMTLKFNSPPGDAFMSASFHVNKAQLVETLILAGPKVILLPFLWTLYILLVKSLPHVEITWATKKNVTAGILYLVFANVMGKNISSWTKYFETPVFSDLLDTSYPSNVIRSAYRYIQHEEKADTISISGRCTNPCSPVRIVFVLGESVRPDHMSLYGYNRQTTPFLNSIKSEIITFSDVVSTANWTVGAVPSIIYHKIGKEKASLVRTMKEAGFSTAWFSNEPKLHFGNDADQSIFADDGYSLDYRKDTALLPYYHAFINQAGPRQFVVLHTFGSHISYDSRYNNDSKIFKPTLTDIGVHDPRPKHKKETINSYDNTIVELDKFLKDVIERAAKSEVPTVVIYESDHGEDLFDDERNRYMHAMANPTTYSLRVPLFVWANSTYRQQYAEKLEILKSNSNKAVNHLNMMPTLLSLAGVTTNVDIQSKSLTNRELIEEERFVMDTIGKEPLNFKNLR